MVSARGRFLILHFALLLASIPFLYILYYRNIRLGAQGRAIRRIKKGNNSYPLFRFGFLYHFCLPGLDRNIAWVDLQAVPGLDSPAGGHPDFCYGPFYARMV